MSTTSSGYPAIGPYQRGVIRRAFDGAKAAAEAHGGKLVIYDFCLAMAQRYGVKFRHVHRVIRHRLLGRPRRMKHRDWHRRRFAHRRNSRHWTAGVN